MCLFPFSRVSVVSVFVFVFIFIFMSSCCECQSNNSSLCVSSCGNIKNISYPFRLNGDPKYCGDTFYELDCQNNQTVVTIRNFQNLPMKYIVESISYNNYTIRVVDPGLINPTANCSFPINTFPYTLEGDISSPYDILDAYALTWYDSLRKKRNIFDYHMEDDNNLLIVIIFISCVDPISYSSSSGYIDNSFCSRGRGRGGHNHTTTTYGYIGVVNYRTRIMELPETCGVEEVAFASVNGPLAEKKNIASLVDIHQGLSYGFELSWYRLMCRACMETGGICSVYANSTKVTCEHYSCPANESPLIQLDLLRFRFRFTISSYYIIKRLRPGFFCYLSFWVRGLGDLAIIVIGGPLVIRFFIGLVCLMVLVVRKWRKRHLSGDETIEDFLQGQNNLLPIKYSYSDIKKMTNKFKHKLGEGGYGIVYKGKLRSGPIVAVKMTNKSISNEREFSNEVGTIGRVHHVNVVQLIGFCTEGSKRALVYEYMPNGSLDKYISPTAGQVALTYKNMFDISLGVARGIDYLHKGCDMQILHFDIKPHNILLDEEFKPKVSDFGLAKLYPTDVNTVTLPATTARGTTGYMAPELFYKNIGGVSYKADVYSFGMLLMELASRKENINPFVEDVGQIYFPSWVYDQFNAGKEIDLGNVSDEERMMVKKMIKVALWCIQMKPSNRPSMNKVVEMLERDDKIVLMPPRPFIAPHAMDNWISAPTST